MKKNSRIFVAGGQSGLVGTAIVRKLRNDGYTNIVVKNRDEVNLLDSHKVAHFFARENIEYVFLAAAKVGGILANKTQKADFIYENLQIQNNVIYNSWKHKIKKLLFLGSSCIYPKHAIQPIKEEYLLTGHLEETNDAYAIAKIAGIFLCQGFNEQHGTEFISAMPTNIYGPNDNFHLEHAHVLPAMIRKFHDAKVQKKKEVVLWGTGEVYREFLHVNDLADALVFLMNKYKGRQIINIGYGSDITIRELSKAVKKTVGYTGKIIWDKEKPNGTPRKLLDSEKISKLGWKPKIQLDEGIHDTYKWFFENYERFREK